MSSQPSVFILDTSSIIRVRELLPNLTDQQQVFRGLDKLAKAGLLAYPQKVVEELGLRATGDLPFLWAKNGRRYLQFQDPPYDDVRRVLKDARDASRTVIDPNKTHEDADPYVLAEALHIRGLGRKVTVITEDQFDTPSKISIVTACKILGLPYQRMEDLLRTHGLITR